MNGLYSSGYASSFRDGGAFATSDTQPADIFQHETNNIARTAGHSVAYSAPMAQSGSDGFSFFDADTAGHNASQFRSGRIAPLEPVIVQSAAAAQMIGDPSSQSTASLSEGRSVDYSQFNPLPIPSIPAAMKDIADRDVVLSLLQNSDIPVDSIEQSTSSFFMNDDISHLLSSDAASDVIRALSNATGVVPMSKSRMGQYVPQMHHAPLPRLTASKYTAQMRHYPPEMTTQFVEHQQQQQPKAKRRRTAESSPSSSSSPSESSASSSPIGKDFDTEHVKMKTKEEGEQGDSIPNNNEDDDVNEDGNTSTSNQQISKEEKMKQRAKQSREASRRYRQRKKELMDRMKKEMAILVKEKEELLKRHECAIDAMNKLKAENMRLQQQHKTESSIIEEERQRFLVELQRLMNENAPDHELLPVLDSIAQYCHRIHQLGQFHLMQLLSPNTVTQLLHTGFFKSEAAAVEFPSREHSVSAFARKILYEVPNLAPEQARTIQRLVDEHYEQLKPLREEREELNREILRFLDQPVLPKVRDTQDVLRTITVLEYLRENLSKESNMSIATMARIAYTLTPRQRGEFYLRVEFVHSAVMQLKAIWDTINHSAPPPAETNDLH